MEVMEASTVSPHLLLLGGFNAHLGQTREPQTHQFKQLLERFPQLSTPRLNQTQHTRLQGCKQRRSGRFTAPKYAISSLFFV